MVCSRKARAAYLDMYDGSRLTRAQVAAPMANPRTQPVQTFSFSYIIFLMVTANARSQPSYGCSSRAMLQPCSSRALAVLSP